MFLEHKNSFTHYQHIPLRQLDKRQVLTKIDDEFFLVSNVCPHQKSLITTYNRSGNRVCPYHAWSFDPEGNPINSGVTGHYCQNEKPLSKTQAYEWNSLLFSTPVEFDLPVDFSNLELIEDRVDKVKASSQKIMDLFLDVDHISIVHPKVYDKIDLPNITEVKWKYYPNGNIQIVEKEDGSIGAAWIALYPGTMIEWQPGALFVTIAVDRNDNNSDVFIFKYKDKTSSARLWETNEDVWETAWDQDKRQAELLTEFSYENLEEAKLHFRKWIHNGTD